MTRTEGFQLSEIPSLNGQVAIVTGGELSSALAHWQCLVITNVFADTRVFGPQGTQVSDMRRLDFSLNKVPGCTSQVDPNLE